MNRHSNLEDQFKSMLSSRNLGLLVLALTYLEKGKFQEAIEILDQAMKMDPKDVFPINFKIHTLLKLGRFEETLPLYEATLELQPDQVDLRNDQGCVLHQLARNRESLAAYDELIRRSPEMPYAWGGRGMVLHDMGLHKEAIASLEHSLRLLPGRASPWNSLGNIYYGLEQYDQAIQAFDKAIALDPGYAYPWHGKGLALLKKKDYSESKSCLFRAYSILGTAGASSPLTIGEPDPGKVLIGLLSPFENDLVAPLFVARAFEKKPSLHYLPGMPALLNNALKNQSLPFFSLMALVEESVLPSFQKQKLKALVFHLGGDPFSAMDTFKQLEADTQTDFQVFYYQILSKDQVKIQWQDDLDSALDRMETIERAPSASTEDLYYGAHLLFLAQELRRAEGMLYQAIRSSPSSLECHFLLAEIQSQLGDPVGLGKTVVRILELENSLEALDKRGYLTNTRQDYFRIGTDWKESLLFLVHYHELYEAREVVITHIERHPLEAAALNPEIAAHLKKTRSRFDEEIRLWSIGAALQEGLRRKFMDSGSEQRNRIEAEIGIAFPSGIPDMPKSHEYPDAEEFEEKLGDWLATQAMSRGSRISNLIVHLHLLDSRIDVPSAMRLGLYLTFLSLRPKLDLSPKTVLGSMLTIEAATEIILEVILPGKEGGSKIQGYLQSLAISALGSSLSILVKHIQHRQAYLEFAGYADFKEAFAETPLDLEKATANRFKEYASFAILGEWVQMNGG